MLVFLLVSAGETTQRILPGITPVPRSTLWVLPLARLMCDVSSIAVVGGFLVAGFFVPIGAAAQPEVFAPFISWAVAALGTWSIALIVQGLASVSEVFAVPLARTLDPLLLKEYFTALNPSRVLLVQLMFIMLMLGVVSITKSARTLRKLCVLALVTASAPALTGHSGLSRGHQVASSWLAVHLVSMLLWCGGLLVITVFALGKLRASNNRQSPCTDRNPLIDLRVVFSRYSTMAVWCFVGVTVSGLANAYVRLGSAPDLVGSVYGRIVLIKVALLVVLGGIGIAHRSRTLPRLGRGESTSILRLAAVEVGVMATAVATAVVLARTPFPAPRTTSVPSPSELALGISIPPEPNAWLMTFGTFQADPIWLAVSIVALGGYVQLARRIPAWPRRRLVAALSAAVLLTWATSGGLGVYSHVLFSAHMGQHMVITLAVPILIYLLYPYELLVRARRPEVKYEGLADWLAAALAGNAWKRVTRPATVVVLTALGFWGIYFTPVFGNLMASHWGHLMMQTYLLVAGLLFVSCVLGNSMTSAPVTMSQIRTLLIIEPIHITFSLAVMFSGHLIAAQNYSGLRRPYRQDLLGDQQTGGVIGLIIGEGLFLLLLGILLLRKRHKDVPSR